MTLFDQCHQSSPFSFKSLFPFFFFLNIRVHVQGELLKILLFNKILVTRQ